MDDASFAPLASLLILTDLQGEAFEDDAFATLSSYSVTLVMSEAIPLPGALVFMLSGLGAGIFVRRKRT